ncbi:MAG: Ig-like domain-containing protein [Bacteroidales bacterium]
MSRVYSIVKYFALFAPLLFIIRCANPVSPSGGPKDEKPPVMTHSEPPLFQTGFKEPRIRIWFDEFITLNKLNDFLLISPPMNEPPEITVRGKMLQIDLPDNLKEETTYNIYFGEAITDITEGNPLTNFSFAFSTGPVIDSLTLAGKVVDAFTQEPVAGAAVMLYTNSNDTVPFDSLPVVVRPEFLTRTLSDGSFRFRNLPDNRFKLFALQDANASLTWDNITEPLGFADSLVRPWYDPEVYSSVAPDTSKAPDSVIIRPVIPELPVIRMFTVRDTLQRRLSAEKTRKGLITVVYKRPLLNPKVRNLPLIDTLEWYIVQESGKSDTLQIWVPQETPDSLFFRITDASNLDDTIAVRMIEGGRKRKNQAKQDSLPPRIQPVYSRKPPVPGQSYHIGFPYPVTRMDTTRNWLFTEGDDTLAMPVVQWNDSVRLKLSVLHTWKQGVRYKIVIPDSVFTDIRGMTHDTLRISFSTRPPEELGSLIMNFSGIAEGERIILELINDKKIIRRRVIDAPGEIKFEYLDPAKYRLRAIFDRNNNGEWDPGSYFDKIQPEEVRYFPKELQVRANWDLSENWKLD